MKIKILGSSSSGNCYIIGNDDEAIILECGLKFSEIQEGLEFNVQKVKACLVSHEHGDHSKAHKQIIQCGIPLYCSQGTAEALKLSPERYQLIYHGGTRRFGDWTFRAFSVEHDASEPLGFIIEHPDLGSLLFVTDTYILKHDLSGWNFDVIMMESNYCKELAEQRRSKRDGTKFVEKRRLKQHMSFQTALITLERLKAERCSTIVLTHLSDGLTDAQRFESECVKKFGVKTVIADKGVNINLKGY